jgi:hypothetical protein
VNRLAARLQPLFWRRCRLGTWLRLLARQHCAFDRALWPRVLSTTLNCAGVSVLGFLQDVLHGSAIRRTTFSEPPLFVLGHWRSGTTYLHDLLSVDERYTFPTRYDCAAPDHFLLTGGLVRRWRGGEVTSHRLMDNVRVGLNTPAEDEIGLSVLGVPSPYSDTAFPNQPMIYRKFLDLEEVAPRARAAWKRRVRRFWQGLIYKRPGRLLLKSPTHTARIKVLLEMFPTASFVHIVRNPYDVFTSTRKTLTAMWGRTSLQAPPFPGMDEFILATYVQVMDRLEADRRLVDPARFCEVRYEDLARDPLRQVQGIYAHLNLGGFERVQPALERYLATLASYQKNQHELSAEVTTQITNRWGRFIDRYGYARQPAAASI